MDNQEILGVFEVLKDHIGQALHLIRFHRELVQQELAEIIGVDEKSIDDIEKGRVQISFRQFESFCRVLGKDPISILKVAKDLQEYNKMPEEELLRELKKEVKYRLWETEERKKETLKMRIVVAVTMVVAAIITTILFFLMFWNQ